MKKLSIAGAVGFVAVTFGAFVGWAVEPEKRQWEYKVVEFDREQRTAGMEASLQALDADSWEYVGPPANNGLNATLVAFRRRKPSQPNESSASSK